MHELPTLRRIWRSLDAELTGHLPLSEASQLTQVNPTRLSPCQPLRHALDSSGWWQFATFMKRGKRAEAREDREDKEVSAAARALSARAAQPSSAVRTRVSSDAAAASAQRVCARELAADRSQLSAEADKLEEALRQMRRDDALRTYREQRAAIRRREAVSGAGHVDGAANSPSPAASSRPLHGRRSAMTGDELPPAPHTDRPSRRVDEPPRAYLLPAADHEHRRLMATYRRIAQAPR